MVNIDPADRAVTWRDTAYSIAMSIGEDTAPMLRALDHLQRDQLTLPPATFGAPEPLGRPDQRAEVQKLHNEIRWGVGTLGAKLAAAALLLDQYEVDVPA